MGVRSLRSLVTYRVNIGIISIPEEDWWWCVRNYR